MTAFASPTPTSGPAPSGTCPSAPHARPPRALLIGSQVMRGGVGMSLAALALERRGVECWVAPTAVLASRPRLGRMARMTTPAAVLESLFAALDADGALAGVDAVLTGWFADADQVAAAARAVARVRAANPAALHVCDPVMGDAGALYVAEDIADAIARDLAPAADVVTPNAFEMGRLRAVAGDVDARDVDARDVDARDADAGDAAAVAEAVRRGVGGRRRCGVVTSFIDRDDGHIVSLIVDAAAAAPARHRRVEGVPNGTGDLFSGLLTAALLVAGAAGQSMTDAFAAAAHAALDATAQVAAASAGADRLDLRALS